MTRGVGACPHCARVGLRGYLREESRDEFRCVNCGREAVRRRAQPKLTAPSKRADVLTLVYERGLSAADAARIAGVSRTTVDRVLREEAALKAQSDP